MKPVYGVSITACLFSFNTEKFPSNLKGTRVTDQRLDAEIKERDFLALGGYFDTLLGLPERLHLTPAECADVKDTAHREGTQCGVAHALKLWRRVDPSKATYRALLDILASLRRGDIAVSICKYIVETYQQ